MTKNKVHQKVFRHLGGKKIIGIRCKQFGGVVYYLEMTEVEADVTCKHCIRKNQKYGSTIS